MRHRWGAVLGAAAIVAATVSAYAHKAEQKRLKPGPAATVHKAQQELVTGPAMWLVGGGVVVGGVALAVSGGHNHAPAATTTSAPSTTSATSTTGTSGG